MRRGQFLHLLVALSGLFLLPGCQNQGGQSTTGSSAGKSESGGGAAEKTFTLGLQAPLTGNNAEFGIAFKMGAELFKDELNAAGGLNGRQLVLNEQDDHGKADQAQSVASTLASDDAVLAVIGPYNSS